ncbi:MAG: GIY-YIG nuclease family protein [Candidatus Scalindua sediminis]|nr:GIY-YIG nuclease family protein [Candidatus Scalindua sediminis]
MNPAPSLSSRSEMFMDGWYMVYILKSKKNNKIYIGCTSNIEKRMKEHQTGLCYYTSRMLPVELIYYEAFKSKKDAFEREKRLKYYGSALRNLKLRIQDAILSGGAG